MKYILVILIIIIIYLFLLRDTTELNENKLIKSKCWINNKLFPEAKDIFDNKNIIIEELNQILNKDLWAIWSNDYQSTPIFTNMKHDDIIKRLNDTSGKINSTKNASWRLFGLILNKELLPNSKLCPNTIKLLAKYSDKILNAGFSLLEPKCYIGSHRDFNDKFYRLHIPLIIPKSNNKIQQSFISEIDSKKDVCVLQVESDYKVWKDDEYFIFDDTCQHDAWNNTNENRIVLLVDLLK
jgi:beta-hydroxylase